MPIVEQRNQTIFRTLVVHSCINCGMLFGMDSEVDKQYRKTHEIFHCPAGHQQHYTGPTEDQREKKRLETELDEMRKVVQYKQDIINGLHESLTQQKGKTRAEKAAKTRLNNRVKNGVCPCCDRTVRQLADHMKDMHPEYVEANPVSALHEKISNKKLKPIKT